MQTELDAAAEAHGSREFESIRSFRPGRNVGAVSAGGVTCQCALLQPHEAARRGGQRGVAGQLAAGAVGVDRCRAGRFAVISDCGGCITTFVLVLVVSQVLRLVGAGFVRAVGRGCSPDHLQRQKHHHDKKEDAVHGGGF